MGFTSTETALMAVYFHLNACNQCIICPESSSSMEIDMTWGQNGYTWMSISTILANKMSFCNYAWIAMMILFNFNSLFHHDMQSHECKNEFLNGTYLPCDKRHHLAASNICYNENSNDVRYYYQTSHRKCPVQRSDCARW